MVLAPWWIVWPVAMILVLGIVALVMLVFTSVRFRSRDHG